MYEYLPAPHKTARTVPPNSSAQSPVLVCRVSGFKLYTSYSNSASSSRLTEFLVKNQKLKSHQHRLVKTLIICSNENHSADQKLKLEVSADGVCVTLHVFERKLQKESTMKTDDRNGNVSRVRIAVLGSSNVGKSALTVRYLTRRFIGEYRSNTDLLYRQIITVNNMPLEVEIVDVSGEAEASFPSDQVAWADGCLIVYSVTDRQSYLYAEECMRHFQKGDCPSVQTVLLANKMDLEHLREVDEVEGQELSKQYGCHFHEISVAEDSSSLYKAFEQIVTECRVLLQNTKTRKFSVSKMIGTLIGGQKNVTPQGGTVVVCNKNDLHRSRVLKRRQNLIATASL